MSTKTKSQLSAENASLKERLAGMESGLFRLQPAEKEATRVDLTENGTSDDSLRASEVRYRRLFETAKDGILLLDADTGRITDVNPFLEDLLGYSHTELIGKALWQIGPVKDIVASQEAMRHLQHTEYIRYEDLPLETKSGQHLQVEFVSNVYLVDGLRVIQCNIRDITARKRAEERVRMVNDELLALVSEMQWRDKEMMGLNRMNDLLHSCTTPAEAYQVISMSAAELFPGQNGCLAIFDPEGRRLKVVALWGAEAIMEPAFPLEFCWALRRGRLHEVIDPQAGLICQHFTHTPRTGYVCIPLTVQGETLGMLCLISAGVTKNGHQADQRQWVVMVGEAIKLSLSNLRLRDRLQEQATRDLLTGLFNRRYLDETLPRELTLAQRRKAPLSVVMLDIDRFKEFNDTFGHSAGDELLRELGRVATRHLRDGDISCRYGGDEFVFVLPDSSAEDTLKRVEEMQAIVRQIQIRYGEQLLGAITVSAGIAQALEGTTSASELLRASDQALYAAKQAGRDQILVHAKAVR